MTDPPTWSFLDSSVGFLRTAQQTIRNPPFKNETREGTERTGDDSVLATPPDSFHVNLLGKIPNALLGVQGVVVLRVHDTSVLLDPHHRFS